MRISRRAMLRGAGAALGLPLLDAMAPSTSAAARRAKPPVRLVYLYFPNGAAEGSWAPRKVGPEGELLELGEWMKPLEPFRGDLLLPENLWTPRGNGHGPSTATWLTGGGYDRRRVDAGGTSVDQLVGRHAGKETLLPSLELSLRGEGNFSKDLPRNHVSWISSGTPAVREVEPRVIFDRMFLKSGGPGADRSVLDGVLDGARRLSREVGAADRAKVSEYLDSVREIEKRLAFAARPGAADLPRPDPGIPADHGAYVRLMMDLLVLALRADATRVVTFMLDHGQSNRYFNFIPGVKGTWHALSHWKDISGKTEDDDKVTGPWESRATKRDMYNAIVRWHHEQFAYLLGRLKEAGEGGGTLLDSCLILYGSGISDGHEHGAKNLPLLVAGRGGGTVRTGRHLRCRKDTSLSQLHLAFIRRMGMDAAEFGGEKAELAGLS